MYFKNCVCDGQGKSMQNGMQRNIAIGFCLFAILIGTCVLIGWTFDIPLLKSVIPKDTTMKANTAICMILSALSILFLSIGSPSRFQSFAVIVQSMVVISIASITLVEYFTQQNFGIDEFWFTDPSNVVNPGRMSPTTAFCFLSISIAIILALPAKGLYLKKAIAGALSTTVLIISALVLINYIPDLLFKFRLIDYTNMSIHTSVLFILLSSAVLILVKRDTSVSWVLGSSITSGCVVWLLSLIILSVIYYNFMLQIKNSNSELIHTNKIIKEMNSILIALEYFDINQRNYLLTDNKALLENREKSKNKVYKHLDNTDAIVKDGTKEQLVFNQLKSIINQKIDLVEKKPSGSGKLEISAEEFALNSKILEMLDQIQIQEDKVLSKQEKRQSILFTQGLLISPLGIYLSIAMLCIGLFLLNSNIAYRKKITAKQKQLADIVASSDDAIIGKNLNSIITSWNKGAEQIFGYTADEIVGQSILILIPPDRIEEETQIINKIKHGEKIEHFETVRKRKDGKALDVSVTVSPIYAENQIIGASKIVRDITERKHLEGQLHQSQKMSAIGQLTGGVAHDFNNLLGIILGNLDLLERQLQGNEDALKRVKSALNAASRGADLTKRMLAFSRLQHLKPAPTVLNNSIATVVEMAARILGENIEIITKLDPAIPPIMIDATELESALVNLSVNARDAMPKGGKLIFTTKMLELGNDYLLVQSGEVKPGTYVCVSVTDSGEGMPPEIIERVFEPFFTTKEKGKGTGMGLSMVYGFIKQSGGIIRIYSEVGQGTTISLYFPYAKNLEISSEDNQKKLLNQKFTGKALVVDDETELLEIASTYLRDMGFEVFYAENGASALEILAKTPDIILLVTDINMPGGMTGIDLAKKVRQLERDIVIVYSSGFSEELFSDKSINLEEILINKPYSRETFIDAVSRAMNNRHT